MKSELFGSLLAAPDASLPWDQLANLPWWQAMAECPQDRIHHAEGDVATHTRMVVESLQANPAWQALPTEARGTLLLAALLHDIGKPATTREEDGRITARGHSGRGEVTVRRMLWEAGTIPFAVREQVAALIRFHQNPFFLIEREDSRYQALRISQTARCDYLALLAEADARGRICADPERMLLNVALFREYCAEQNCLTRPWQFPSDHSRFLYFRGMGERDPEYHAYEESDQPEFIILSGLPGTGKDTYIQRNLRDLPVISLDELRTEMGVSPREGQERVLDAARTQARVLLRQKKSLVWNATNLSRELRDKRLRFADDYGALVRIIYLEVPAARQRRQNKNRDDVVPDAAIERMLHRWEIPDLTEAQKVEYHVDG